MLGARDKRVHERQKGKDGPGVSGEGTRKRSRHERPLASHGAIDVLSVDPPGFKRKANRSRSRGSELYCWFYRGCGRMPFVYIPFVNVFGYFSGFLEG